MKGLLSEEYKSKRLLVTGRLVEIHGMIRLDADVFIINTWLKPGVNEIFMIYLF